MDSLLFRPRHLVLVLALLLAIATLGGCVATSDEPSEQELAELDSWATTADGKSDLPDTWAELIVWLRDIYQNRMSAIWADQEHPATPAAAMTRIRAVLAQAGITDPTTRVYSTTVQRLRTELLDHSEINVVLSQGRILRLVGDPKGAGAFFDYAVFKTAIGAKMCLTWSELEDAVEAAYLRGAYGTDYVCHTVTERVLRAIGAGSSSYAAQIRTYQGARWIWGPVLPSGNPQDPSDWDVACPQ